MMKRFTICVKFGRTTLARYIAAMRHKTHTLPNGLRVVFIPMPQFKTATIIVMTGTGSRYETARENGLAHFLEHMAFKGTRKRPNALAISQELDGVGASYNAFTSEERTAYFAKVASRYLDVALDVISDIFLNATLPGKEIQKERGAIIQEIDMYEDIPMRVVSNVFDALIFGKEHPLGRTILGPKENIRVFTRADFINYHARNYTPGNTVVCVAGKFSELRVLRKITRDFGHLKKRPAPEYLRFESTQHEPRVAVKKKKTDQTQLMLGVLAYPYEHKDEYTLEVLAAIMGGGMSSRLFTEVREKRGLAYSVRAWAERCPDTGYLTVQAGVEHSKLTLTIKTILAEFRKLKRVAVSRKELKKAKAHLKGELALDLETSDSLAESAASWLINVGSVRSMEEMSRGIDKVTARDVQRVARDLLKTETLNLAVIGPHESEDELRGLLKV